MCLFNNPFIHSFSNPLNSSERMYVVYTIYMQPTGFYSSIHSITCPSNYPFIHSFADPLNNKSVCTKSIWSTYAITIEPAIYSFKKAFINPPIHPSAHSSIHSPIHWIIGSVCTVYIQYIQYTRLESINQDLETLRPSAVQ